MLGSPDICVTARAAMRLVSAGSEVLFWHRHLNAMPQGLHACLGCAEGSITWPDLHCYADPADPSIVTEKTRQLGLIVARGTAVTVVAPSDGTISIENPFLQAQQEI